MTTNKYPEFVNARLSPYHKPLHIALGLLGEWYEYRTARNMLEQIEEMGDLCFYLQAGINLYNLPYRLDRSVPQQNILEYEVEKAINDFADEIKKLHIYRLDRDVITPFNKVVHHLHYFIDSRANIAHVIMDNMHKLSKRYNSSFTPEEAEARKDKCED